MSTSNRIAAHPTLPGHDILVCIFQRGAADALNSVIPYGDIDAAANKIQSFNDHRDLLDANSDYIKEKSITRHDVNINAPHILNVIERLIEN